MTIDKEQLREAIRAESQDFLSETVELRMNFIRDHGISAGLYIQQALSEYLTALDEGRVVEWLPIESAPRDGTVIIVFGNDDLFPSVTMAQCRKKDYCKNSFGFYKLCLNDEYDVMVENPTHWMPLPKPPTTERED